MSLNIYTSNRMENLLEALAGVLKRALAAPLAPEVLVVQSRGMQRWVSMELARRFGVWANSDFPFPNTMIWKLFASVLPGVPDSSQFDPEVLTWKILDYLPGLLERDEFSPLRHYLVDDQDGLKGFQLAAKIADTFDQYTLFRPEMLQGWEKGEAGGWQAILWRQLVNQGQGLHRGQLMEGYRRQILGGCSPVPLPERISLFGISYLPKHHLDILAVTARLTDINLFLLSPTREYWADIRSGREQARLPAEERTLRIEGNPLLASLGKLGRDFSDTVVEAGDLAAVQEDLYRDSGRQTLLQTIQSDILNLRGDEPGAEKALLAPEDQSVQIHSCHSPLREIEVLHDQILAMLERHEDLEPRDILVMTPDIEAYAPYVATVFEGCQDPALKIPFSIADRSLAKEGLVASALLKLLLLPGGRLTVVEVLDLLESPPVYRRFDLDEGELEMIRGWLEDVRVRWGLNEQDRLRLGLPAYRENSFQAGLDRLLLGYAMSPLEGGLFNDMLPYDEIEGSNAKTLGKLCEYVSRISRWLEDLNQPRRLGQWGATIRALVADFVAEDEETAGESAMVARLVSSLDDLEETASFGKAVGIDVVRAWLTDGLNRAEQSLGFLAGGVTFCAMLPMRSIPFKVVALVGMGDGAFPRQSRPPGFDLIAMHPQRGDRSRRDEDRYLFLEAILSARESLYISYVGQSIKDNSEMPPSVLVSELLDAVDRGFTFRNGSLEALVKRLVTKHRLQAFSPEYFRRESPLFSYSAENCAAQIERLQERVGRDAFLSRPLAEPPEEWKDVPLANLLRFFANPAKFFLESRLGIRLQDVAEPLEEREPFAVAGLEAYQLQEELLVRALAGEDLRNILPALRSRGILPPARHGELVFAKVATATEDFAGAVREQFNGKPPLEDLDFELELDGFRLSGRLHRIWPERMLRYRCAKMKPKDQVRTWIEHLVLNAVDQEGYPGETSLTMTDATTVFAPVAGAAEYLRSLLELYWEGLRVPLRFFPVSAMAYAKSQEWSMERAVKVWEGNDYQAGEKEDPHFGLCFGQEPPLDGEFDRIARILLTPLLQHQG